MEISKTKTYICIDLKSFYASVECVERGLDPFKTNLVVADPERGEGTLCLAVSPAMKALGIPGRCRVFEIPKSIKYIKAKPRMALYLRKSAEIFSIYMRFVSPDDIFVYSVDECFIDISPYRLMYKKTAREFAEMLREAVYEQTGICATVGIGSNLFLAKLALDIISKHTPEHIGMLDEKSFKEKIWRHRPLTDIWNIGEGTAKKLEKYGVYDLYGISNMPHELLYRIFGINARHIINHANGIEYCTIADIKKNAPKSSSLSSSQILLRDYSYEEAELIMHEMVESSTLELIRKGSIASVFSLTVEYSRAVIPAASKSKKSDAPTSSYKKITHIFDDMYSQSVSQDIPIRRVAISFGKLEPEQSRPISFFEDTEQDEKERSVMKTFLKLQERFGKNSIMRGRDLLECATRRDINSRIGGHNKE